MGRSILAVAGGYFSAVALVMIINGAASLIAPDAFSEPGSGEMASDGVSAAILAISLIAGIAGGAMTGVISKGPGVRNAIALGIFMTVMGVITLIYTWEMTPIWYNTGLVLIALPSAYGGGKLHEFIKGERELARAL